MTAPRRTAELLAPAGEKASAYAAFAFGADAVYTGLPRFSARAEAVNLSPRDLEEVVAFAHSRPRPRRVYVTLNTLLRDAELPDLLRSLALCADCGADAVIVQDFGVARLARRHFPALRLHASTQMALHNLEGVRAAARLGFTRVTLARELTLAELRAIARHSPSNSENLPARRPVLLLFRPVPLLRAPAQTLQQPRRLRLSLPATPSGRQRGRLWLL